MRACVCIEDGNDEEFIPMLQSNHDCTAERDSRLNSSDLQQALADDSTVTLAATQHHTPSPDNDSPAHCSDKGSAGAEMDDGQLLSIRMNFDNSTGLLLIESIFILNSTRYEPRLILNKMCHEKLSMYTNCGEDSRCNISLAGLIALKINLRAIFQ